MTEPTSGITAARRAHSARCRQRVIKALNTAVESGEEISISSIARKAAVDRYPVVQFELVEVDGRNASPAGRPASGGSRRILAYAAA